MKTLFYNTEFFISTLLGILGLILSIYFYYVGRKFRQISYTSNTTCVSIKNDYSSINNINFMYKDKKLDSISITDLLIWSNGKEVINRLDVAPSSPLTVYVTNQSKLLEYQIIHENELSNNFNLTQSENKIIADFDYLSKNNGIAIRIIHTGTNDDILVGCKLKDGRKTTYVGQRKGVVSWLIQNKYIKKILSKKITSFIFIVFTIFLFPNAFVQSANYANNNYFGIPNDSILMNLDSIVIFVLCATSFVLSLPHIYNLFKTDPPKDLIKCSCCER
ncbi:hypothetical protein [Kineothrix sedimenti]|uniref:Uncharacterized protein n=1 Tax=Kineothrix sedimenti TaxID=3123317 RepID=A0ABZ3F066_9FIRM